MSKALVLLLFIAPILAASDTADINHAIETQQAAWNRGDIPAFMDTYSGDCTFVGSEILRGRAPFWHATGNGIQRKRQWGHCAFRGWK